MRGCGQGHSWAGEASEVGATTAQVLIWARCVPQSARAWPSTLSRRERVKDDTWGVCQAPGGVGRCRCAGSRRGDVRPDGAEISLQSFCHSLFIQRPHVDDLRMAGTLNKEKGNPQFLYSRGGPGHRVEQRQATPSESGPHHLPALGPQADHSGSVLSYVKWSSVPVALRSLEVSALHPQFVFTGMADW